MFFEPLHHATFRRESHDSSGARTFQDRDPTFLAWCSVRIPPCSFTRDVHRLMYELRNGTTWGGCTVARGGHSCLFGSVVRPL